ncbi:LiaF transmembrane domain-containing protein [Paludibacterium paludis]|uniref:LiaF transmembrane domain-containing protein n=1 Tax=Paludibacterium paludis TaxID=1225769 RepID=A0A918U861_9NEIS|nr:hypothetical protein [Paludibacterium paludis]GGY07812.1 hypothetical protein GCM10011289_07940 [Paludibacterium paludis]
MHYIHFDSRHRRGSQRSQLIFGLSLIGAGLVYALSAFGILGSLSAWSILPALLAMSGAARIATARHARHIAKGAFHIAIAAWLYVSIEHILGLNFHMTWPVGLILLGMHLVLRGLLRQGKTGTGDRP